MSDWIDLQLAHSLTGVQAPDDLWARINAPAAPRRRPLAVRWAVPAAIAASVMVLLARPVREDRVFESTQPAAVVNRMAHEARAASTITAPPSPPPEARISGAPVDSGSNSGCRRCHTL